jgi:fructose-1,6-bisphosphatase/inositol monophosphatase family enzyme
MSAESCSAESSPQHAGSGDQQQGAEKTAQPQHGNAGGQMRTQQSAGDGTNQQRYNQYKIGHNPVTEADRAVDAVLRQNLLRDGEGWLSQETADNPSRLDKERVWIVDPLDGTREFVKGLPEFCVSTAGR